MEIPVIIMGVTGRMGATLLQAVRDNSQFSLVGAVERAEKIAQAEKTGCPVSTDIRQLLRSTPTATILDFSTPQVSIQTAQAAAECGARHVVGTTGFDSPEKQELERLAARTSIFWAPNMSVGINALLKVLPQLVQALGSAYDLEVLEIHHNKKKDAPSGTALRLAECLAASKDWVLEDTACYHREGITGERPHNEIGIQTLRGGDVVGVHTVYCIGTGERIEITHQAQSRENFASGALRAAAWLQDKPKGRLYTMQDIL